MASHPPYDAPDEYRTRYLKLKTVVHDSTTELSAYPVLISRLRTMLDGRRRLGVVHIEVSALELVESLYGWQVLDRILHLLAERLRSLVGNELPASTLLAVNRVAGDRFVAFLPETPEGNAIDGAFLRNVCGAVQSRLQQVFDTDEFLGLGPRLTVLVGHALLTENPYFRFERRVHAAVNDARDYHRRMRDRRELSSGEELKRIIQDSEISTLFHPVVDLGSRRSIGFEALSRGPKGSMFESPSSMFTFSGKVGVEMALDRLCRNLALRECSKLDRRGMVFLNVLPDSLDDPEWLGSAVAGWMRASSIEPANLILEISERSIDGDPAPTVASMEPLRRLGYRFAIDDVGTGYASLSTLEKLRPEYVKVDHSLVRSIDRHLIKQEALASLLSISSQLGADLIAEGVETESEAKTLHRMGVRFAQGFLFSRPAKPGLMTIPRSETDLDEPVSPDTLPGTSDRSMP